MIQTLTHHPAACLIAFLSLVVLTFVANRLGLISWLAWLVRNEEDRHKEKRDSEDTDEYWEDTPVKSGAPQPVGYKRQDDERQIGDQASCRVAG